MSTIVTRAGRGSPLTNNEVDSNFTNLNTDKVETITSADGSVVVSTSGTTRDLSVGVAGSTATLISQVRNETGATLTKGTVVYISGAAGNKAIVSKALATGDSTSAQTYGVIQADIPNNQNGYVVVIGAVSGLNTSAYADGTQLYLSGVTAGTYTSTKPYAPTHLVYVGVVTYSHATQGTIQIKIQNGYEMDELHDVSAQSPTNGDTLVFNSTTSLWTKTAQTALSFSSSQITSALGFTPYNATNPSGYISGITSGMVTTALGFTPYNATNPSGYVTAAGARGAISVTGAGSYDSATGVINIVGGVTSFNTRTGAITLSSADVTTALGFTPYNNTNPSGYITGITSTMVTTALGFTPYNSSNPNGYISSITSANVTTALGFTPYNATNPSGYITSSALSGYLTSASAASTYLPLSGGTLTGQLNVNNSASATAVMRLWSAGSSIWSVGVGDSSGTNFNISSDFGSFLINKGTGNVTTSGQFYAGSSNLVLHASNYTSYALPLSNWKSSSVTLGSRTNNNTFGGNATGMTGHSYVAEIRANAARPTLTWHYEDVATRHIALDSDGALNVYNPGETGGAVFKVGGNIALHAGNFSSYALSLGGGTLTGGLVVSSGSTSQFEVRSPSGTQSLWIRTGYDANGTATPASSLYNVQFQSSGSSGGTFSFVTGNDRTFSISGSAVNSLVALQQSGNQVLHASNYTNYTLPLTVSSSTISLTNSGIYVSNPEGTGSIVRIGAAWGKPGVYNGSDFTIGAETVIRFWIAGTEKGYINSSSELYLAGSRALTAANYTSYALPLSGGTMTGTISFSNVVGTKLSFYDTGTDKYGIDVQSSELRIYSGAQGDANGGITFGKRDGTTFTEWMRIRNNGAVVISGNQVLHAGNYSSYALPLSGGTVSGNVSFGGAVNVNSRDIRYYENDSFKEFYVGGDANTYYPVLFGASAWFHFARWSISRGYGDTAPWDPIGTGAHKGGLTLTWEWSGDGAWGGNDKTIRVIQFSEQYTTMVGGMALSVNGFIVWLRGGNAYYRFHGPGGTMNSATPYYSTFTASNGSTYSPRSYDSGTIGAEVTNRMPVRGTHELYDTGNRVLHGGNYSSYALPLSGGTVNGNLGLGVAPDLRLCVNGDSHISGVLYMGGTAGTYNSWGSRDYTTSGSRYINANYFEVNNYGYGSSWTFAVDGSSSRYKGNAILHAGNYTSYSPSLGGSGASGTWGINVTGNSATATKTTANSGYARVGYGMAPFYNWGGSNAGAGAPSDSTYTTGIDVGSHPSDQAYGFQIASNMWNVGLWTRTYNSGFSGWVRLLDSSNYTSYSPSLTGSGASGSWGINITGTATGLNSSNNIARTGSSGNLNTDFNNTPAGTMRYQGDDSNLTNSPGGTWWIYEHKRHSNGSNYWGTQVAWGWEDNANLLRTRNVSGGNWSGWVTYLNSNNYTSYSPPYSGGTLTGSWYFLANRNTSSDSPPLQAYSNNGGGAIMSFHRGGYYAVNFGLDSDNVMRIGGWSASANRWQLDMSGNMTVAGNVTAYSDERLKKDWASVRSSFVEVLASIKSGTYTRIDSDERQAGVSAQDFEKLLPEVVSEDNEGKLSLAYGNAALVSAVELAKRVVEQEKRIAHLESLINKLIGE